MVRTFFFVIFGMTIVLSSLVNVNVAIISILVLVALYLVRYLVLKVFVKDSILPELFIAPRGLITILLFFAIPAAHQVASFDSGILLYVILVSSLIMTFSLINDGKRIKAMQEAGTLSSDTTPEENEH